MLPNEASFSSEVQSAGQREGTDIALCHCFQCNCFWTTALTQTRGTGWGTLPYTWVSATQLSSACGEAR